MTNEAGDKIATSLHLIRASWEDMLPEGPGASGGPHTTGSKEPPPPAPIAVMSLRREVCEQLASWCRLVIEDAVDIGGGHMTVRLDGSDALAMAGWLLTWADFLGAHPASREAVREIGSIARQCDAVAKQRQVRQFPVGPCVEHGTSDQGERVLCSGTLIAVLRTDDDLLPAVLSCDVDSGHQWDATQWRSLGQRIHGAVTAEDAAKHLLRKIFGT